MKIGIEENGDAGILFMEAAVDRFLDICLMLDKSEILDVLDEMETLVEEIYGDDGFDGRK